MANKIQNELFFVVLPQIFVGGNQHGLTNEVLTLLPELNFATRFFPDEVNTYIATFQNRLKYMTGGHVKSYDIYKEEQDDGRIVVRVVQNVE
ncbi:MAG: hypothetical protein WBQ94_14420 [Terracidiphilus sp.]|jgi:hypothetical protein